MASSDMRIRFDEVTVDIFGEISVSEIEIAPRNYMEDKVYTKKASVVFPNTFEMIKLMYDVRMDNDWEMPDSLIIRFDGMNDPLISEYGQYAQAVKITNANIKQRLEGVVEPVCDGHYMFGPAAIKEMGYDAIFSSMFVAYEFNRLDQKLSLRIGGGVPDAYTVTAKVNLENLSSLGMQDLMSMPSIDSLELVYQDDGLMKEVNRFCSSKEGITVEEYIKRFAVLPDDYYAISWGLIPNQPMKAAYLDFMKNPDNITITSYPPQDFNPMILGVYEAQYLVEVLGLSLSVNDKTVTPFELNVPKKGYQAKQQANVKEKVSEPKKRERMAVKEPETEPPSAKKEQPESPLRNKIGASRVIPPDQISDYVGHYVKVSVERSKHFTGILVSVEPDTVSLQLRHGGGTFTMPIKKHRIESIERLR
ncbi:hypothetical protein GCM10023116_00010 [Kistimonas scapharcae]|uniref:Uncharacterized protein n=2 Tax=Kistimonas scapharcae TaxID=1036133 RepID=A0ABP8UVF2_9GAMM